MYKEIQKNNSWENISRAEYGVPSRASDLEKLNNNRTDGTAIVYDYKANNKNQQESANQNHKANNSLQITINNTAIPNFTQADLINSIQDIRSAIVYLNRIENIKIFDHCSVTNNGKAFLKGYIKNITPILNAENSYYILQIKSFAGILLDSVVPLELEFINSNLKEIINRVSSVYNIKTIFTEHENNITNYKINNEIETSASAKLNESCWSFITRLCNSRGLLIQDTGTDAIAIGRLDKNNKSKTSIVYGQNSVTNWTTNYNYDILARYYEVYSQFNTNSRILITLDRIKLPITKRIINNDINEGILKDYGNWIVCREIGKAVKLQIELNANLELETGDVINIENKHIGFEKPTDMLVEKIILSHPNKTILILTLPCAYTGIIPDKLPLIS